MISFGQTSDGWLCEQRKSGAKTAPWPFLTSSYKGLIATRRTQVVQETIRRGHHYINLSLLGRVNKEVA
jgi:hypothetical protein